MCDGVYFIGMEETRERTLHKPSLIEEIRAQDIYTLHYPDKGPTLPTAAQFSTSYSGEPLINRDSALRKSRLKCRTALKKVSLQNARKSLANLPALFEEDISYQPSLPMFPESGEDPEDESSENDDSSLEILDDDDSWVDLSKHTTDPPRNSFSQAFSSTRPPAMPLTPTSPDRVTPLPFGNGEEYLRLLREAQKESNQSSARVSLASSRRDTPRDSPKSPPNSPNTEMVLESQQAPIKGVYINYYNRDGDFVRVEKNVETDWIWDWSSRPDQSPPKEWRFVHPGKKGNRGASIRRLMVGNSSLFSRDVLYTMIITNVLSLLLGTGIGIWLSKRSGGSAVTISTMPIN